jgi:integrase
VTYRYDFWLFGQRHTGSTFVTTEADADAFEAALRAKLRRRKAGLDPAGPEDTPTFTEWAGATYTHAVKRKKLKRPEQFKINLKMILAFWGRRPTKEEPVDEPAPYHNLRLGDPIADPEWLEKFELWMDARKLSGSRRNAYRSACSALYRVGLMPTHRKRSQVRENPFERGIRDRVPKRIRTFTLEQLREIITQAPAHVGIALGIGALAPKLRLRNILDLKWGEHVDESLTQIVDPDHKTDRQTGLPLVVNVSKELRAVLETAQAHRRGRYVVHYRGKHVDDIKTALKHAVQAAAGAIAKRQSEATGKPVAPALLWGRAKGVTFHSLRHTMATELARMGLPEALRARLMGHADLTTTQIYTHLVAADETAPLEALGARMPVADVIKRPVGKSVERPSRIVKMSKQTRRSPARAADR